MGNGRREKLYITTCSHKDVVGSPMKISRESQLKRKPRHTVSATESVTALGDSEGTPP